MTEEKNGNILAGLCYIPLIFINVIAALYVILAKKGGSFARFHAVQGLLLFVIYFIVISIIQIPFMAMFFNEFVTFQTSFLMSGRSAESVAEVHQQFMEMWLHMFSLMLPIIIIGLLYLIGSVILAIMAFQGKKFRIPLIAGLADKLA